jgi:hypothetical protein
VWVISASEADSASPSAISQALPLSSGQVSLRSVSAMSQRRSATVMLRSSCGPSGARAAAWAPSQPLSNSSAFWPSRWAWASVMRRCAPRASSGGSTLATICEVLNEMPTTPSAAARRASALAGVSPPW